MSEADKIIAKAEKAVRRGLGQDEDETWKISDQDLDLQLIILKISAWWILILILAW